MSYEDQKKKVEGGISRTIDEAQFTYNNMVWIHIYRIQAILTFDNSNPGMVNVVGPRGEVTQLVRDNYKIAFISAVWGLYAILYKRMATKVQSKLSWPIYTDKHYEEAYSAAKNNYLIMMDFLHTWGIFGHKQATIVIDWRSRSDKKAYITKKE